MGGSGGALAELWEALAELREALGELWEGLFIQKPPINRPSGRYVNNNPLAKAAQNQQHMKGNAFILAIWLLRSRR